MQKIIAVTNQKGGVGKSTTAINLGAGLSFQGERVLLVDLDPQGNTTSGLGIDRSAIEYSTYDVLVEDVAVEDAIEPSSVRDLFVVPATIELAGAEIELVSSVARERRLERVLAELRSSFEIVQKALMARIPLVAAVSAASSLAIDLARRHDALLHVLHLTTAVEMDLFTPGHRRDKRITAEVCVHHLWFDESRYEELGTRIKCNPAIKTAGDRQALVDAVKNDRIDVIATDHAPHTLSEKQNPYFKAPAGLPLVQHALVCVLELHHDGLFSLPLIAEKTAHAPARLFRLKDRGFIREGYWADLTLVDLNRPQPVDEQPILSRCGWSPFDGLTFRSSVAATIVSGHLAFFQGYIDPHPAGKRLQIDR